MRLKQGGFFLLKDFDDITQALALTLTAQVYGIFGIHKQDLIKALDDYALSAEV
jgi:hypothetical protein